MQEQILLTPERPADWRGTFLSTLHNRDQRLTKGFVALATTPGVAAVQAACFEQDYNPGVLTARYRISGSPVVGTLVSAFANDLLALSQSRTGHLGDLRARRPDGWAEFLSKLGPDNLDWVRPVAERPNLDWETLGEFFRRLGSALTTGDRLVLLASGHSDRDVWAEVALLYALNAFLPYRIAVVLGAGANRAEVQRQVEPASDFIVLDGVPEDPASTEDRARQGDANLTSDRAATDDHLGRTQLANTLANLLLHRDTGAMCVGVEAPWGKGKSSFLNLVEKGLYDIAKKKQDIVVVKFDAWQYDSAEQAWAGLARAVIKDIESSLGRGKWRMRASYAWRFRRRRLLAGISVGLVGLAIGIGLFLVGGGEELQGVDLKEPAARLFAGVTGISVTALVLIGSALRLTKPVADRVSDYLARPNYGERLGFQHEVIRDLTFCQEWLVERRPDCRVVVMVDDLDRCSDEKTVELLQAINLVLAGSGLYVLLCLDGDVVRRAVYRHYAGNEDELPGKFQLPDDFAEDYLRKIVQFSVHLPGSSTQERIRYLDELLQPASVEVAPSTAGVAPEAGDLAVQLSQLLEPTEVKETLVKDTADDIVALKAYQHVLEDNPRELKRMVNVHRFVKIALLRNDEQQPPRTQRLLVQWLMFCTVKSDLVPIALETVDKALADPTLDTGSDVLAGLPGLTAWVTDLRQGLPEDIITPADLAPGTALRQAAQLAVHLP
jgi:hypothetical protein